MFLSFKSQNLRALPNFNQFLLINLVEPEVTVYGYEISNTGNGMEVIKNYRYINEFLWKIIFGYF